MTQRWPQLFEIHGRGNRSDANRHQNEVPAISSPLFWQDSSQAHFLVLLCRRNSSKGGASFFFCFFQQLSCDFFCQVRERGRNKFLLRMFPAKGAPLYPKLLWIFIFLAVVCQPTASCCFNCSSSLGWSLRVMICCGKHVPHLCAHSLTLSQACSPAKVCSF